MSLLSIEKDRLTIDGEPFYLACGDIQYFRIHPSEWKRRLEIMKDFGLTAVQTYCAWNLHEPTPGVFDFSGMLDLGAFLRTCAEVGLKVMLRPSPYICGEWDFGGLPWWLLKDRHMSFRCADLKFMSAVDSYYKKLCAEFVPYLSTNGGPILAVCIENEYGAYGSDLTYLRFLADTLAENGVNVPLYQTDNFGAALMVTRPLGVWQGINYRIESASAVPLLRKIQPDMPPMVGEYWSGRSVYWGESGRRRDIPSVADGYRKALDLGAYVTFYMFAGGTNFGFMNGSRIVKPFVGSDTAVHGGKGERIFRSITTSYDCDALLSESGVATEKYYACRKELDEYLGREVRTYRLPAPEMQEIRDVKMTESAPLFGSLGALCSMPIHSAEPMTFEELDCPYGFVLYSTETPVMGDASVLDLQNLHDRALVFVDGEYKGTFQRDFPAPSITIPADEPHRLDLLVENMGRINTRPQFIEEKGLIGGVTLHNIRLYTFENTPLPMTDLSELRFEKGLCEGPRFVRGHFDAKPGVSTNLHFAGWKKGVAFLNGFNLGRYWCIGPQATLYVPGALLKEKDNELILFELYDHDADAVEFLDHALLDAEFREDII